MGAPGRRRGDPRRARVRGSAPARSSTACALIERLGSGRAAVAITALTTVCCAWRWRLVARGLGVALPLRRRRRRRTTARSSSTRPCPAGCSATCTAASATAGTSATLGRGVRVGRLGADGRAGRPGRADRASSCSSLPSPVRPRRRGGRRRRGRLALAVVAARGRVIGLRAQRLEAAGCGPAAAPDDRRRSARGLLAPRVWPASSLASVAACRPRRRLPASRPATGGSLPASPQLRAAGAARAAGHGGPG